MATGHAGPIKPAARSMAAGFPPGASRPHGSHVWTLPAEATGLRRAPQYHQAYQSSSEPLFPNAYQAQSNGIHAASHSDFYGGAGDMSAAFYNTKDCLAGNGSRLSQMQMLVEDLEAQNEEAQERIIELEKMMRPIRALLIKMNFLWEGEVGEEGVAEGRVTEGRVACPPTLSLR